MAFYQKHLFFCTNLKDGDRKCCGRSCDTLELAHYAKNQLKDLGIYGPSQTRVSTTGCLGRCSVGPNLLIYPDNVWYTYENQQDIDEIIEKHVRNGSIVDRLCQPE